jgi:hypothetical protein
MLIPIIKPAEKNVFALEIDLGGPLVIHGGGQYRIVQG